MPVRHAEIVYMDGRNIDCDAESDNPFRASVRISTGDIKNLLRIAFWEGPIAWLMNPQTWPRISRLIARVSVRRYQDRTKNNLRFIESVFPSHSRIADPIDIEVGYFARRFEERYGYLRSHRPGGWHPVIRIHGQEHIENAAQLGKGVIFWGSRLAFNHLITKIAFFRLGLNVYHYSRPIHGLSHTQFGTLFINPIWTKIERRYLRARVISENNIPSAMQILQDVVQSGGAVSITTGNWGKRNAEAPFFNSRLNLSTGAIAKAREWNAALLPTYVTADADGSFDVTIGKPLVSDQEDLGEYCAEIVKAYAVELEPFVRQDPTQWRGFELLQATESPETTLNHRNR